MLDTASNGVMCDRKLIRNLGLKGRVKFASIRGSVSTGRVRTEELNLSVSSMDNGPSIYLPRIKAVKNCTFTNVRVPLQNDFKNWPHLDGIECHTVDIPQVTLLIGTNAQECFVPADIRKGENGPLAIKGILGWSLLGNRAEHNEEDECQTFCHTLYYDQCELFWRMEKLSASDREPGTSVEDRIALEGMSKSIKLKMEKKEPHYQMSIPWRQFPPPVLTNRQIALRQLLVLKLRFEKDPEFMAMYCKSMREYFTNSYAGIERNQPIPKEIAALGSLYITHHGVYSMKKPGKLRVVFNCALKYLGLSLNDCIYSGPDLIKLMIKLLLGWRLNIIAIIGDVEAMYHRVRTEQKDWTFLRFLWFRDGDVKKPIEECYMKVHIFGCISSSACASYALAQTAIDNKDDYPAYVVDSVTKSFYVDDFATSHEDDTTAIEHCKSLTHLLAKGGFHLKKFDSNSKDVVSSLSKDQLASNVEEEGRCQSVLGIDWQVNKDKILLFKPILPRPSTRAGILGFIMAEFDPLGLKSPVTFQFKNLLQEICRAGVSWNEELPELYINKWHELLEEFLSLKGLTIDRCMRRKTKSPIKIVQLHTFSDASTLGYACVSYLRYEHENGEIHVSLVAAKARVAPIKPITIRRLELQGVVIGVRQAATISETLNIKPENTFFWTDCQCVLKYLNNQKRRFQTYVANRITEIHETTDPSQFAYVKSAENVADDATRKFRISTFDTNSRWFNGPEFLRHPIEEWRREEVSLEIDGDDPEVKTEVTALSTQIRVEWSYFENYGKHYSSLQKLKSATAWLIRYVEFLKFRSKRIDTVRTGHLTIGEMRNAMNTLMRICQREAFPVETNRSEGKHDYNHKDKVINSSVKLDRRQPIDVPKSSQLRKLCPILRDGILCLRGRLLYADLSAHTRQPSILPKDHYLTKLVINECHVIHGHQGMNYVLSELRMKYWIVNGKFAIKKELSNCMPCRRYNARGMEQFMADLPITRLSAPAYTFQYTGTDAFGPFLVKHGRGTVKRWTILFTDLVYRCCHMEVIHSMETDSFIMAYQRFCSRRGKGELLISDRGSNFMGADRELREAIAAWNSQKIESWLRQREVEWRFNAAGASHHGGVWERLIRSARSILNHLLTRRLVNDEQFATIMAEVESILNGRPLQPASSDPNDLAPLTPNHLLLMRSNPNLPVGVYDETDTNLRKRWKVCQVITNQIAKRLTRDYLLSLNTRSKWLKIRETIKLGDLVLINEPNKHRSDWALARVNKLFPSRDGLVRSVGLKTQKSDNITRPITKVCLLEGSDETAKI